VIAESYGIEYDIKVKLIVYICEDPLCIECIEFDV